MLLLLLSQFCIRLSEVAGKRPARSYHSSECPRPPSNPRRSCEPLKNKLAMAHGTQKCGLSTGTRRTSGMLHFREGWFGSRCGLPVRTPAVGWPFPLRLLGGAWLSWCHPRTPSPINTGGSRQHPLGKHFWTYPIRGVPTETHGQ